MGQFCVCVGAQEVKNEVKIGTCAVCGGSRPKAGEKKEWWEVPGYWMDRDKMEYERLVSSVPDGSWIVEVGCFRGRSLASIAETIRLKKLLVWAVDIWGTRDYDEPDVQKKKSGMLNDFVSTMKEFDLHPFIICGTSADAAKWASSPPSLVFIDADHSYEAVKTDIESWFPLLPDGGTLCGHDYDPNGASWPGVYRAVTERFQKPYFEGNVWSVKK